MIIHGLEIQNGRIVSIQSPGSNRMVVPGFVDAHCHIIPMGLDLKKLNLSACSSPDEVLDYLSDWTKTHEDEWVHAVHYDQTKFDGAKHLTRHQLDAVINDRPVLLRHSNGHASVANSRALEFAKIDRNTPDPPGGEYVRDESGELTGVLLERSHEHVTNCAPEPTLEDMVDAVISASEKMAAYGVTCATDMMTGRWNLEKELLAYDLASKRECPVRLRMYAQWSSVLGPRSLSKARIEEISKGMNPELCRLNGLKIFADGAIGSATAAVHEPFITTGACGQLIYSEEKLNSMVRLADQSGWSIAIHTIGDRSTDLVMNALEATEDPSRHRVEHAMILSDHQISRLASLGSEVSMQPEFLTAFGHAYVKQLGPQRASQLKRFKSILEAGIPLSFSSDRPIVEGNPWDGIRAASNRPIGFDASENISKERAFELYTKDSARANGDHLDQGVIKVGSHADFQIYEGSCEAENLIEVYRSGVRRYCRE